MPNGDYRGFKKQGDALKINALSYNRWQRAATWVEGQQQSQTAAEHNTLPEGMCWIQNSSGSVVARFGVLGISGTFFNTSAPSLEIFQNDPVLTGVTPTTADHTGKFAIAYEPIANGAFGRAFVFGICAVQIFINSSTDGFADVMDSDSTQLTSGAQGSVQIVPGSFSGTGTQWAMIRFGSSDATRDMIVQSIPAAVGGTVPPYVIANTYSNTSTGTSNVSVGVVIAHAVGDVFMARPCSQIMNSGSPLLDASNKSIGMMEVGSYGVSFAANCNASGGTNGSAGTLNSLTYNLYALTDAGMTVPLATGLAPLILIGNRNATVNGASKCLASLTNAGAWKILIVGEWYGGVLCGS